MAIPPSVFIPAAKAIRGGGLSSDGWNRIVVEKPFGHDLESSQKVPFLFELIATPASILLID